MSIIDEDAVFILIKKLKRPCTVDELMQATDMSRRTVYRYLEILQERGIGIFRANMGRPTLYQIK